MKLKDLLRKRAEEAFSLRGWRKPIVEDVFERTIYIFPDELRILNYFKKPLAAFNPGAMLVDNEIWVFPRLIFDYHYYTSSIGFFKIGIEDLLNKRVNKPLETKIILWPQMLWEFRGCEDARAFFNKDKILLLYTGFGYMVNENGKLGSIWVQGLAKLNYSLEVVERDYIKIVKGDETLIKMKDSAFIKTLDNKALILCRPSLDEMEICWSGVLDLKDKIIYSDTMNPVIVNEKWEFKVGWSTNTVRLSSNEYLVGWHGIVKRDYSYREGLALFDENGELLAISNYLLSPQGIIEGYGDRPHVIFGNGLIKYKDILIWIGGISDYGIGFFKANLDKVMEKLRWIKG